MVASPDSDYVPFDLTVEAVRTPADVLKVVSTCGRFLSNAVVATSPDARGWHPCGMSDPAGFAATGITEILVHTHDITQGLGVRWRPPEHLCASVLDRLFPNAPAGDPSQVLLWSTGGAALGGRPPLASWVWDASVP